MKFPRRPGPGWKDYELNPVWEHVSGLRVHSLGGVRFPDGEMQFADTPEKRSELNRAIAEQGNPRRGLMVWGLAILAERQRAGTAPPAS